MVAPVVKYQGKFWLESNKIVRMSYPPTYYDPSADAIPLYYKFDNNYSGSSYWNLDLIPVSRLPEYGNVNTFVTGVDNINKAISLKTVDATIGQHNNTVLTVTHNSFSDYNINNDFTICMWAKAQYAHNGELTLFFNIGDITMHIVYANFNERIKILAGMNDMYVNMFNNYASSDVSVNDWNFYCLTKEDSSCKLSINDTYHYYNNISYSTPLNHNILLIARVDTENISDDLILDNLHIFPERISDASISYIYDNKL